MSKSKNGLRREVDRDKLKRKNLEKQRALEIRKRRKDKSDTKLNKV